MDDRLNIQRRVAGFVEEYGLEAPVQVRVLDLISEVGELSKEVLKATDYGREPFQKPQNWDDELGDVSFSLVCIANSTGVDLEGALDGALEKYRERLTGWGDMGSGR